MMENTEANSPEVAKAMRSIQVGRHLGQVSPPTYWEGLTGDRLRGALDLAYFQYLDGLGASASEWMGLTEEEFSAWMRDGAIPKGRE